MAWSTRNPAINLGISAWLALAAGTGLAGCGDDGHDHEHGHGGDGHSHGGDHNHDEPVGPDSEAICPDDSTLTYETFGKMFMEDYCTRCHSSQLEGETERLGAPDGHDFDTIEGIQHTLMHIDQVAAAGPMQVNQKMPLGEPKPTLAQRQLLGEWLACGAPEE